MPCLQDSGFQKRNLSSEVVLCFQYPESTTILPRLATVSNPSLVLLHGLLEDSLFKGGLFLLLPTALLLQFVSPQTTFLQDPLHSFGLTDKLPVDWEARNPVCIPLFEYHALLDAISPHGIMHLWLLSAWPKVHPVGNQCILCLTCVAAGVVEGEYRDITGESFIEDGDGFFRLFYHLLRVPPAIITAPTAIFNDFGDVFFSTLFIAAIQPSLGGTKEFRNHYSFALGLWF